MAALEEKTLEVKIALLAEELKLEPEHVRRIWTSNRFQQALALLQAWTGTKVVLLRATSAGVLKTAPTGAGFELNKTATLTSAASYAATAKDMGVLCSRADVIVETNDVYIKFSPDDVTYGVEFYLPAGAYSLDVVFRYWNAKDRVSGSHGTVQVVGWY